MHTLAKKFKLTRLAPTPSGFLHLGNALSFALTSAIAKLTNADVILRIDDLDRDRVEQTYIDDVFETLQFLGIQWQFGPLNTLDFQQQWSQLCRLQLYKPALGELARGKKVFACICSRKQLQAANYTCNCAEKKLPLDTVNAAWRLITDDATLNINTLTKGTVELSLPSEMKNFIVRKKDGHPAYQLSSLIDDVHFGVDLVVRGEDLWPSTIAQHYLARCLNLIEFNKAIFHHHQLLTVNGSEKLSKSAGATSIQHMRAQGLTRADIYNKIGATLGITKPCAYLTDISNNLFS